MAFVCMLSFNKLYARSLSPEKQPIYNLFIVVFKYEYGNPRLSLLFTVLRNTRVSQKLTIILRMRKQTKNGSVSNRSVRKTTYVTLRKKRLKKRANKTKTR